MKTKKELSSNASSKKESSSGATKCWEPRHKAEIELLHSPLTLGKENPDLMASVTIKNMSDLNNPN